MMNATFDSVPFVYDGRDKIILPKMFIPGDDVVIIGRGKKVQQHPANRRFKALIESQLEAYSNAATKGLKSNILWRVLLEVRSFSPSRLGFVKRDNETGRWYAIDDASAKINISQAFRDGLHSCYKSSKKRKQVKRKAELSESDSPVSSNSPAQDDGELERNIFHALSHMGGNLQRSSSEPAKRVCVATNEQVIDSPEQLDHSFGRIGPTMDRLCSLLDTPDSAPQSDQLDLQKLTKGKITSWDTFECLYKKFGADPSKLSDNPFEPKPILPAAALRNDSFMSVRNVSSDVAYSPFAMSLLVEATSPPVVIPSSRGVDDAMNEFDNSGCMQRPMLPSILSLDSLDLSDIDTLNGANSLSSMSSGADINLQPEVWDFQRGGDRNGFLQTN